MKVYSISEDLAKQYLRNNEPNYEIIDSDPLYDRSNTVKGYLFHLEGSGERGYITVFALHGTLKVTEACFEKDILADEDKIYYNGLMECYVLRNGSLYNARTEEFVPFSSVCRFEEVNTSSSLQYYYALENEYETQATNYTGNIYLDYTPTAIDQHDANEYGNAKCMQTSAAMLIQYYKDHRYSDIATATGGALIDELSNFIPLNADHTKTTIASLKTGLGNYLANQNRTYYIYENTSEEYWTTLTDSFKNTVYAEIMYDRPLIAIIGGDAEFSPGYNIVEGTYSMHALLVRGINIGTNVTYVHIIDPWDATYSSIIWDIENSPSRQYAAIYSFIRVTIGASDF